MISPLLAALSAVHQFCIIGAHVMVGGCSGVAQDVPPFVIAQGNHAMLFGVKIAKVASACVF